MPYATLNGIRIHYEVYGQGDPVLLVSGLGGAAVGWLLQVKDLSARYQVITFDNRGVGESEMPDLPAYPTALLADDAAAVLDHLRVARAHVVGASMGGTIGPEANLLEPTPASCRQVVLPFPVITNDELAKIRHINRDGDLPGQMVNRVGLTDRFHKCVGVPNVATHEGQILCAVCRLQPFHITLDTGTGQIIKDGDTLSFGKEIICQIAADKAGAAGYQDAHVFAPAKGIQ